MPDIDVSRILNAYIYNCGPDVSTLSCDFLNTVVSFDGIKAPVYYHMQWLIHISCPEGGEYTVAYNQYIESLRGWLAQAETERIINLDLLDGEHLEDFVRTILPFCFTLKYPESERDFNGMDIINMVKASAPQQYKLILRMMCVALYGTILTGLDCHLAIKDTISEFFNCMVFLGLIEPEFNMMIRISQPDDNSNSHWVEHIADLRACREIEGFENLDPDAALLRRRQLIPQGRRLVSRFR